MIATLAIIANLIGYTFGVVIAHFLIKKVTVQLWKTVNENYKRSDGTLSMVQGFVERTLYIIAFQIEKPEFVGVWVALKVASQWKKWSEKTGYNIFLTGSGLSIIYALVGAYLIKSITSEDWLFFIIPIILTIGTLSLAWIVKVSRK